jgi:dCMP deaminase
MSSRKPYRPESGEYLLSMAVDQAARCNCRKTPVGAIIARDDRIISTGYNGTIGGFANCVDGGCPRCGDKDVVSGTQLDRCICVHAEQNALLAAARFGVRVQGAACWVTNEPCLDCTKQLIQAELGEVWYWKLYPLQTEQQKLRDEMRRHAVRRNATRKTQFKEWSPDSNILDLEARYAAIKTRIDEHVGAPKSL